MIEPPYIPENDSSSVELFYTGENNTTDHSQFFKSEKYSATGGTGHFSDRHKKNNGA
jgi:hypothetical protein